MIEAAVEVVVVHALLGRQPLMIACRDRLAIAAFEDRGQEFLHRLRLALHVGAFVMTGKLLVGRDPLIERRHDG